MKDQIEDILKNMLYAICYFQRNLWIGLSQQIAIWVADRDQRQKAGEKVYLLEVYHFA